MQLTGFRFFRRRPRNGCLSDFVSVSSLPGQEMVRCLFIQPCGPVHLGMFFSDLFWSEYSIENNRTEEEEEIAWSVLQQHLGYIQFLPRCNQGRRHNLWIGCTYCQRTPTRWVAKLLVHRSYSRLSSSCNNCTPLGELLHVGQSVSLVWTCWCSARHLS